MSRLPSEVRSLSDLLCGHCQTWFDPGTVYAANGFDPSGSPNFSCIRNC